MSISRHFDHIAIGLSALCIVHCLAVPLVVAVLPIVAVGLGGSHFHALMLWLVVPVSAFGFILGYRIHRNAQVVAVGALAVAVLAVAALHGHDAWPEAAEIGANIGASLVLAAAHWVNFRDVRRLHRHGE